MGKKYALSHHQKEVYRSRYSHIAPDLVDGIVPQSFLSDIFSFGQLIKKIVVAHTGLQQLASRCTTYAFSDRLKLEDLVSTLKSML